MMAYLLPYLLHYFLRFLLHIEFQGVSMAAFCFCCFLCCLSLCFALPRKPTIKALSWSQAWYLLLHHCLSVSGDQCYKPAAVLALLSCFLGRLKHLSLLWGRCFQPYCNDHSVSWTSLLNQMWAVNLILFSCTGSQMVGDVTQRSALRQLILGWPQQVHLDSSAAVQEVMLGHLKAWDQG